MANEEQVAPKQQAEVNYWGDIDAMMKDLKLREAVLDRALGEKAVVTHNAIGPWYSWQSPDGQWHEGDKIGWPYDFHTDDLLGQILGNPLSHFLIGLIMGARQSSNAAIEAVATAAIEAKHSPAAAVEAAEIEGLYKPPKKTPTTMVYGADGKLKGMYVFKDFEKEGVMPGAYPGMMEGAMGGAGGEYGGHCDEECEFVQDLSKKVQELEAYAGVPGAEA